MAPRPAASDLGYVIDWPAVRAMPPVEREESGDYTCSVTRTAADSLGSYLLGIAECSYPPTSLVAMHAASKGYEFGSDTAHAHVWWMRGQNERRIPYAATRGALEHFLKLTEKYREHDYAEPGAHTIFTSDLVYRATIRRRDDFALGAASFRNVYVASVALTWRYDDGTFLPTVSARRTVVLSPEGAILAIDGDGRATEDVLISANRAVGRERQLVH